MATLVLAVAGSAWGGSLATAGSFTSVLLATAGATAGGFAGSYIDRNLLFRAEDVRRDEPKPKDVRAMTSSYGSPIPKTFGYDRLGTTVIWMAPTTTVRTVEEVQVGGKGFGGTTVENTVYNQYQSFAVLIGRGVVGNLQRIRADGKVIYSRSETGDAVINAEGVRIRFYPGTETQTVDPTIESFEGVGNAPAYLGMSYLVFRELPLPERRLPNIEVEIASDTVSVVPHLEFPDIQRAAADNIVRQQLQDLFAIVMESQQWERVSISSREVVMTRDTSGSDGIPYEAFGIVCDFDIDEEGNIYTAQGSSSDSRARIVRLDGETFATLNTSDDEFLLIPSRVRVFRSTQFPFVVGHIMSTSGQPIVIYERFSGNDSQIAELQTIYPSTAFDYVSIALDHENGNIWALEVDNATGDTFVERLSPTVVPDATTRVDRWEVTADIDYGSEILYDPDTDQVVVVSTTNDSLAAFDASDPSTLMGVITSVGLPTSMKSTFQQGAVDGYLYLASTPRTIQRIDLSNLAISDTWVVDDDGVDIDGASIYDPLTESMFCAQYGSGVSAYVKVLLWRTETGTSTVVQAIEWICGEAGLSASEIDTSLLDHTLRGYTLRNRGSARSHLEPLIGANFIDAVDSDGAIKFVPRTGVTNVLLLDDDLGAHVEGQERPPLVVEPIKHDLALPRFIEVSHTDPDASFATNVQRARRDDAASDGVLRIDLPLVLHRDDAMQFAVKTISLIHHGRIAYEAVAHIGLLYAEPTDVCNIAVAGMQRPARIVHTSQANGLVTLRMVRDATYVYESNAMGTPAPTPVDEIAFPGPTLLVLMDLPLLSSRSNAPGLYIAAMGYTDAWTGFVVSKATRLVSGRGWGWQRWHTSTKRAIVGTAISVLGDVSDPFAWDHANSVTIRLVDPDDVLSDATEDELLDGANAGALGQEIIQWSTTTVNAGGSLTLGGSMLRGRLGSEFATSTHAVGERFVLLTDETIGFHELPMGDMNDDLMFGATSIGMSSASRAEQAFTPEFRNMKPLAVVNIVGVRDGSDNLTITWDRRSRINGEWQDLIDVPLGETYEAYELDIIDNSSSGGGAVVRTISSGDETADYTSSQQTTDFGSAQASVDIAIYQMSSVVGRGFAASATV